MICISYVVFLIMGALLPSLATKPPAVCPVTCPICGTHAHAIIKRSCDGAAAGLLMIFMPFIGLIYILMTMNSFKVHCPHCKTYLYEGRNPLTAANANAAHPPDEDGDFDGPPAASEICDNCGRRIGRLETPHLWHEKIVCGGCRKMLEQDGKQERGLL